MVDGQGCVKVRTNRYSVPLRAGTKTQARLLPAYVEVWHEQRCVARHERSFARHQAVLDLEHYLDVLERKPGALAGSTPLAAVARARALAGEFRPVVAELARAAREAGGHARDDRVAAPGPATRVGSVAESD